MRKHLKGHYIYWHNGGKFDARYFLPYLIKAKAKLLPIKGRMARFILPDGTEFRDSYCLLPISLKSTGEKIEIDYRKMERNRREKHREEIITYWKQDLKLLHDKVSEFVAEYGFGMTLAGRTFDQLKKRFDICPPKCDEFHDATFRKFYYGGRVEFFSLGNPKGIFRMFDINSAYPAAMCKEHAFGLDFEATEKLPRNPETLKRCFVRLIGKSSGGLPFRDDSGSLSFAAHTGEFFVTGWEVEAAKRLGKLDIMEVIECLRPLETKSFKKFVDHFYTMKREAKKGSSEETFAKLFLNSSYGRFGLNPRDFRDVKLTAYLAEPEENEELRKTVKKVILKRRPGIRGESLKEKCVDLWKGLSGKWELANSFDDIGVSIWEKEVPIRSNSFFNVATAASVTGAVRAFMMESLAKVKNPVYCDTDSIMCEDAGELKLGRELGEWKLECETEADGVHIAGKKLYAMKVTKPYWKKEDRLEKDDRKWKLASKGVRLSPSEIVRCAAGEEIASTLIAPTFSLFTTKSIKGSQADFLTRRINRDDKRKRRNSAKKC